MVAVGAVAIEAVPPPTAAGTAAAVTDATDVASVVGILAWAAATTATEIDESGKAAVLIIILRVIELASFGLESVFTVGGAIPGTGLEVLASVVQAPLIASKNVRVIMKSTFLFHSI